MRNLLKRCLWMTMLTCALSGCTGLTVGPQVETRYLIIHPGRPLVVLDQVTVAGRVMDGTGDAVKQDVGGWVMMPPDHWDSVKKALEAKK